MRKFIFSLFLLCTFTFELCTSAGCSSSTGPVTSTAGRRDYTWTVDTIKVPFTYFYKLWGSGPSDVWSIGPGGGLDKTIWHFDGNNWSTDGISRGISPLSIYGFSSSNVWLSGYEGEIWHFDGSSWIRNYKFQKQNYYLGFESIWGDSPNNIYAIGFADSGSARRGIILNYNGSSWTEKQIPYFSYDFFQIKGEANNYYLNGLMYDSTGKYINSVFQYNSDGIKIIYTGEQTAQSWSYIQNIAGTLYFVLGNKIYTYNNHNFKLLLDINESNFGAQIYGRSEKDIILKMIDGLGHYNGSDIEYIYKFKTNNISIVDGVIFDKDIFILAIDFNSSQNLLIHGRLN
ncbi:MAG: hypothetical protein P4L45_13310 [Ignavibacteriaceae bacterium]|nr:hypothetical protein [Ignavibacteriaceae bacterium]